MKIDKNIVTLTIGRALQALLAIATLRMLTEFLPQDQIGKQYLINSVILWFSMVLINPVGMFVNRHLHEWKSNKQLFYYIKQLNLYFFIVAAISIPLIFTLNYFNLVANISADFYIYAYFFLYILLSTWFQTLTSLFNLFDEQKIFISLNIASQFLGLVFAFFYIHYFSINALSWLFGLLTGQSISLMIGCYFYFKKFHFEQKSTPVVNTFFNKTALLFCYPVAITTLFMWLNTQGYRLIVQHHLGLETLASLGVGFGLAASVSSVVESITTQFYYPKYYQSLANSDLEKRADNWIKLWQNCLSVYLPFCFLTISAAAFLVKVLTAQKFHHVIELVVVGAFVELFRQLSNVSYLVAHGEKKTDKTILPYAIGAMSIFILFYAFDKFSSLNESTVGYSLLLSGFFVCMFNLLTVNKLIQKSVNIVFLLKVVVISMPMLLGYFLSIGNDSKIHLFLINCISGLYCVGAIYFVKKKSA